MSQFEAHSMVLSRIAVRKVMLYEEYISQSDSSIMKRIDVYKSYIYIYIYE